MLPKYGITALCNVNGPDNLFWLTATSTPRGVQEPRLSRHDFFPIEASFAMRLASLRLSYPDDFLQGCSMDIVGLCDGLNWVATKHPDRRHIGCVGETLIPLSWFEKLLPTILNTMGRPPSSRHFLRHLADL